MVKGKQFTDFRDTGNPVTAAKIYNAQLVDELIFIDIEASSGKKSNDLIQVIEEVSKHVFMPFCVGGGINTIDKIRECLHAGADKVSICTALVENPEFIVEAVNVFGSQCIVACIDYKQINGESIVFTNCGTKNTGISVRDFIQKVIRYNVGEVILNSIDRDGMMEGYDFVLIDEISAKLTIPVIAMGGAGKLSDFHDVLKNTYASAVSAASIFHFTDQSPIKVNFYLKSNQVNVR